MDKRDVRSVIKDALEEKIPSAQVDLWPAIRANLAAGKRSPEQGEQMNTTRLFRLPRLAFAILAIVALLAVVLATPQGRAFAQSALRFFTRAEDKTFLLLPSQVVTSDPDVSAPTAVPPAPLISVEEAEAQVGFDLAELPVVPRGFNYLGARLYGSTAAVEYETEGKGGHLIVVQSREEFLQSDWDRVPADAIVPVQIGELEAEYTQGTFVVYAGETSATWNPDAPLQRLRWVQDEIWFEMTKFGNVKEIEYLDRAGLVALAESLIVQP